MLGVEKMTNFLRWIKNLQFVIKEHYFSEVVTLIVVMGVVGVFMSLYASTNRTSLPIPYQGRLVDSDFVPVADGTHYMRFAIYTAATGTGSCVWETGSLTGANNCNAADASSTPVTVTNGLFTILLGDDVDGNNPPIPQANFNFETNAFYLGVTACGTNNSCDAQMTPRRQLGGVPYAYNTDLFDGNDVTEFPQQNIGRSGGRIIVGGSAANNKLFLYGTNASGNTLATSSIVFMVGDLASTTAMTILNNGRIGIGTSTPGALFTLGGNIVSSTPSTSTGAFLSFASSTYFDNNTAANGGAAGASLLSIAQGVLSAQNAVSTTNAYTVFIEGPPLKGLNNTATSAIALGIGSANVGTHTNAYGLYVNAPTGATNNYAGIFTGGNVGVGTTTPASTLDIVNTSLTSGNAIRFVGPSSGTNMTGNAFILSSNVGNAGKVINASTTVATAANNDTAYSIYSNVSNSATVTSTIYSSYDAVTDNQAYGNNLYGSYISIDAAGNVNATKTGYGLYVTVNNRNTADQGGRQNYGGYFTMTGNTNGAVTSTAVYAEAAATSADTLYTYYSLLRAGTGVTSYGLYVDGTQGASGGTKYGIYVTLGALATTQYSGIFLGGNFGIGTTTPGALLTFSSSTGGTPSTSTGAFLAFTSSTFTDTNTATGQTATGTALISFAQGVVAATNNVTTTNAYTLFLAGAPVKGANTTSSNAIALGIDAGPVGTQINAYGLYVNSPTGATNNYAGIFTGGNVGIGTTTPSTLLQLGTVGTTRGVMSLAGSTSGLVTVQASSIAGTWTFTLPTSAGTSGQYLQTDGAGVTTWATVSGSGQVTLLKANSGTNNAGTPTNVDTYAFSASDLTAKDTVLVYFDIEAAVAEAPANVIAPSLYDNTSSTKVANLVGNAANLTTGNQQAGTVRLRQAQVGANYKFGVLNAAGVDNANNFVSSTGEAWTTAWTLALRHDGIGANGTLRWSWAVFKVAGQ